MAEGQGPRCCANSGHALWVMTESPWTNSSGVTLDKFFPVSDSVFYSF